MEQQEANGLITFSGFKQNEDSFLNALITSKGANLPAELEQVFCIFEFTDLKAKAFKALSDTLSKFEDQQKAYAEAHTNSQKWSIAAIYAFKRMGEITREMPTAEAYSNYPVAERPATGKMETLKSQGIDKHTYQDAERAANHPELLHEVIEDAIDRGDYVTKTAVLRRIKEEEKKEKETIYSPTESRPKIVTDYCAALKLFQERLEMALVGARRGLFDVEEIKQIFEKHDCIRDLMKEVELATRIWIPPGQVV